MRGLLACLAAGLAIVVSCAGPSAEGMDTSSMPPDVQADYAVFAQRCSKCHSLARPLQSGIEDDLFWEHYVTRMRAMPGSGISEDDSVRILRFLHYYSLEHKKKREQAQ